jgi:hypothetical protein
MDDIPFVLRGFIDIIPHIIWGGIVAYFLKNVFKDRE